MLTTLLIASAVVPLLAAGAFYLLGWNHRSEWISFASPLAIIAIGGWLVWWTDTHAASKALGGVLWADSLTALMLILIGGVALIVAFATPGLLHQATVIGRVNPLGARNQLVFMELFCAAMVVAIIAGNLGLQWIAIEATTITTAFLVGQRRTRKSQEAAWKYALLCSVGIALALLGIIILNYAVDQIGTGSGLDWIDLVHHAGSLDPGVTRMAIALIVFGYGSKAGLAPLSGWMPDAYAQSPTPVAAMMSGGLISVAFYSVLRIKAIADPAIGVATTRNLLLILGLISLAVAATLLLGQRNYKRMLAYSSMEHVGLMAIGAAIGGPLAMSAVLLHMLGHAYVKSTLFCTAGRIQQLVGSNRIISVRGLAVRAPFRAGLFAFGVLALVGMPPFALFVSEVGIARAGFAAGLGWVTALAYVFVVIIAAALLVRTAKMILGKPDATREADYARPIVLPPRGQLEPAAAVAVATAPKITVSDLPARARIPLRHDRLLAIGMSVALVAVAVLGVWGGPISDLLDRAAGVLMGVGL